MNQFLIIVRGNDPLAESQERLLERRAAFNDWVQKVLQGRFVGGAPLERSDARLLKNRTELATDGPFMESKEMISGYMIINASDVEEATRLTRECPLLGDFLLEVRKLKPME